MYCKLEFPHSPDARLCIAIHVETQVKNIIIKEDYYQGKNYWTIYKKENPLLTGNEHM